MLVNDGPRYCCRCRCRCRCERSFTVIVLNSLSCLPDVASGSTTCCCLVSCAGSRWFRFGLLVFVLRVFVSCRVVVPLVFLYQGVSFV